MDDLIAFMGGDTETMKTFKCFENALAWRLVLVKDRFTVMGWIKGSGKALRK